MTNIMEEIEYFEDGSMIVRVTNEQNIVTTYRGLEAQKMATDIEKRFEEAASSSGY